MNDRHAGAPMPVEPGDVHAAAQRIDGRAHRTPVITCRSIDDIVGGRLFFKCENMQRTGAFKFRGAANAVLSLPDGEAHRGVATHSSGNHAAALAEAARERGVPAYIVMPESAPRIKQEAVAGYGGRITFCEPTLAARQRGLEEVVARTGASVVHPYNDARVIAGQGTATLELLDQAPRLDAIVAPIGGGGLLSGASVVVDGSGEDIELFGAEPTGADDAKRSLAAGRILPSIAPSTIADGLLTSLGELTFAILHGHGRTILCVDDDVTRRAMRLLWERAKLVAEPSGAVALGVVLAHPEVFEGRRVGVIVSGGNVEMPGPR